MSGATSRLRFPDERRAALALTLVADVGSATHARLIARFGTASRALGHAAPPEAAHGAYAAAERLMTQGGASGLALVTRADPAYPDALHALHAPPAVLWSAGDWRTLSPPVVAIVGTRRATAYGLRVAREIAGALARAGACIVSGMALGIDACAHRAALDAGGRTVAVLGTGADVAYPRAHRALHREIRDRGLVISEMPPGARSDRGSFPRRNRIIAGLASLTLVVEAPEGSGALITAGDALDLGRDVGVVPGPIDSPQSEGSNRLMRDGAHPIASVADALALVGLQAPRRQAPDLEDEHESRIWSALAERVGSMDELCARTRLPAAVCLRALTALELRGRVECALTGEIRRR